ncbi:MAG: transposase [Acidobacteria bacterium]|nr:transposase [Acidobacteriota bacterium]
MLSRSRLCRRLHELAGWLEEVFHQLGWVLKQANSRMEYLMDSFPVAICDNIRIKRCRLVRDEAFRSYNASKRRYFYGVWVQVLTTVDGIPVEVAFLPGGPHDVHGLDLLPLDLPPGSEVWRDSAYTDYTVEDILAEHEQVRLDPILSESRAGVPPFLISVCRLGQEFTPRRGTFSMLPAPLANDFPVKIKVTGFYSRFGILIVSRHTRDDAFTSTPGGMEFHHHEDDVIPFWNGTLALENSQVIQSNRLNELLTTDY